MLMDDRYPEALSDGRGELFDGCALEDDRAAIAFRRARRDVHQRRLAGPVLSQKGMYTAREYLERDVRECRDSVVVLGDAVH